MGDDQTGPEVPALTAQLRELNERIRFYLTRLWQLSFAYLGIAVLASGRDAPTGIGNWWGIAQGGMLLLAGSFIIWWSSTHLRRVEELRDSIDDVEKCLRLTSSTRPQRNGAIVSVYGITSLGIAVGAAGVLAAFLR